MLLKDFYIDQFTKKIVTLSESELTGLIKRAIREAENSTENYMTFSNLQQMKRQIDMLLVVQ